MSALPPELAPWAGVLGAFAPELAEVLGQVARRLDLLLGRVRARPRPVGDDPEGYDGLDRRGPYDRLLLSEWALADELPDEFDRRAASGEHAFLRLDRRDRAKGARTLVLFDAGPDQLGGPRIVQLAALVVLWRRAMKAHAALAWGVLQGSTLAGTVDRASIQAFLGGRAARGATREDLDRARANAGDADETWIVGGDTLVDLADPGALHLALADVVAPGVAAVDVRLTRGGARLGEARLDLPPAALGRRLLTDPFPPPASTAAPHKPAPRPRGAAAPPPDTHGAWLPFPQRLRDPDLVRFLPGTAQLLVTMPRGDALLWTFRDGHLKSPKPRVHTLPAEALVAVGHARQRTLAVARTPDDKVRPWFGNPLPVSGGAPPAPGHGVVAACGDLVAFSDGADELFVIPVRDRSRVVRHPGTVRALYRYNTDIVCILERSGSLSIVRIGLDGSLLDAAKVPGTHAWLGAGSPHFPEHLDLLLTTTEAGQVWAHQFALGWPTVALRSLRVRPDHIAADTHVLGFAREQHDVAVITFDPRHGAIRHPGTGVALSPARTPLSVTLSPDGKVVAWRTPEGLLEAWSLVTGDPVLLRYPG